MRGSHPNRQYSYKQPLKPQFSKVHDDDDDDDDHDVDGIEEVKMRRKRLLSASFRRAIYLVAGGSQYFLFSGSMDSGVLSIGTVISHSSINK